MSRRAIGYVGDGRRSLSRRMSAHSRALPLFNERASMCAALTLIGRELLRRALASRRAVDASCTRHRRRALRSTPQKMRHTRALTHTRLGRGLSRSREPVHAESRRHDGLDSRFRPGEAHAGPLRAQFIARSVRARMLIGPCIKLDTRVVMRRSRTPFWGHDGAQDVGGGEREHARRS